MASGVGRGVDSGGLSGFVESVGAAGDSPVKIILLAVRIVPADPAEGGPGVVLDPRRDDQVEEFASAL
jgi:hypothetical protein